MEPLRGGKLAALPEENAAMLRHFRPDESVPGWAFRFLQGIPAVTVILSGMSDETQMNENLRIFATDEPLNAEETEALLSLGAQMTKRTALPCTACRYCTSHCPQELNIPWLLELYNEHVFTGGGFLAPMALMSLPEEKKPSACIGCRSCEQVCPQQIKISEAMQDFCAKLSRPEGT
jgi:predicted aldo/keto reductase-like oxidoreductase